MYHICAQSFLFFNYFPFVILPLQSGICFQELISMLILHLDLQVWKVHDFIDKMRKDQPLTNIITKIPVFGYFSVA